MVFDKVICPWFGVTRKEATGMVALTNLCEEILTGSNSSPNAKQCRDGQRCLEQRLRILQPDATLLLGGPAQLYGRRAIHNASPSTRIFTAMHPTARRNVLPDIQRAWEELQNHLRRRE
jgi:hypothetical protein